MPALLQLHSGRTVDLTALTPHDLDPDVIAHGLGHLCRFAGQVKWYYSVAEHCWLASCLAPPALRLAALLHDAHEAFLGDVTVPVREACPEAGAAVEALAGRIDRLIAQRWLRGAWGQFAELRQLDLRLRHTEAQQLIAGWTGAGWYGVHVCPPYPGLRLRCWRPEEAAWRWRERLRDLLLADELRRSGKWYPRRWLGRQLLARMVRGSGALDVWNDSPEHLVVRALQALGLVRPWFALRRNGLVATAYLLTGAGCRAGGASWQLTEQLRDYWQTNGLGEFEGDEHDVAQEGRPWRGARGPGAAGAALGQERPG